MNDPECTEYTVNDERGQSSIQQDEQLCSANRCRINEAERLLLVAVIRRAAYDLALYRGRRSSNAKALWQQAYVWVCAPAKEGGGSTDISEFMSFDNVCSVLGIDPATVRAKLLCLRIRDIKKCSNT